MVTLTSTLNHDLKFKDPETLSETHRDPEMKIKVSRILKHGKKETVKNPETRDKNSGIMKCRLYSDGPSRSQGP